MTNGMDKTGDAMRRIKTYLIIVNLIFLTGCANKAMPDTYVENYDYQYRQWSDSIAFPKVQQGSDIYTRMVLSITWKKVMMF